MMIERPLINPRYRLLDLIGEGGMGAVYRAYDRLTGETVAFKHVAAAPDQLLFTSHTDEDPALALAQEFQVLASLRHPHIIAVRDYGFDAGRRPFFTMDWLENASTIIEAGRDQVFEFKIKLFQQMLLALMYLHRHGIVHRDLKPANVLVTNNTVKVLDFGLSITVERAEGAPVGSLAYMAPEVLEGRPASVVSDLYAVGVIAYELLVERHPFEVSDISRLIDQVLTESPDLTVIDHPVAGVLGQLLAKDPHQRYADAATVIRMLSAATDQNLLMETAETRESFLQAAKFVGRETELKQLTDALAQTMNGQGDAWLIGGESGVGKSRLLDELRTRALVQGVAVLRGQAVSEGGQAYQIWREVLRWVVLLTEPTALEASVLKVLVPDISLLLEREVTDAPELDPQAAQTRLSSVISDLIRQAVANQPLLILLEDIHWAEANSLDLVGRLHQLVAKSALLLVATYRQDETPDLPARLTDIPVLTLPRLSEESVARLSASMLGVGGQQPHLVSFLHSETEGNVFFLVEVVRALAEEAGRLDEIAMMTLPMHVLAGGIQTVVQRRLQRVCVADQPLLQLAAVAGRQLDLGLLRVAEPTVDFESWLTRCANAVILDVQENHWRFAHDKLREGILVALPADRRAALHRQVADAIEQAYSADLTGHYADLVYHFSRANNLERERHYARLAGEQAAAQYANDQALTYLNRAIALTPENDLRERYALMTRREEVFDLLGERSAQQQDLVALAALAESLADDRCRVEAVLRQASYLESTGELSAAVAAAQRAIEIASAAQIADREAQGHVTAGIALGQQSKFVEARSHLERGLTLARRNRLPTIETNCLLCLGAVASIQARYSEAQGYSEEALRLCRQIGDRRSESPLLNNLGNMAKDRGDLPGARRHYEQSLQVAREIGARRAECLVLSNLGSMLSGLGQWAQAQDCLTAAQQLARTVNERADEVYALVVLSALLHATGDQAAAEACSREGLSLTADLNAPDLQAQALNIRGRIFVMLGRLDEADDAFQRAADALQTLGELSTELESHAGLAHVAQLRGDLSQAHNQVETILSLLTTRTLIGVDDPPYTYLICYEILSATHDPRARTILETGHNWLQERAATLDDEAVRRSLLENVPSHRALIEAWAALTRTEAPAT